MMTVVPQGDVDAGHLVPMEAPELVIEEVLRFSVASEARAASSRSSPRGETGRA